VSIFGHQTPLQLTDLPVGVLIVFACSSLGVYGVVLSGWASGSSYPLLGALRSAAQMISYEIAMGLSLVAVFLYASTMSSSGIVTAQRDMWYVLLLLPSFIIYSIATVGETNRAPFDLPEAESELVAGYMTEYSSIKFLLYMLSEYVAMVSMSSIIATLFLGGWRAFWPITAVWGGANSGWWPLLWFLFKVVALLFVFVWVRATLPRLRYDQFMKFGWKVLLPINLIWILGLAGMRTLQDSKFDGQRRVLIVGGVVVAVALVLLLWPNARERAEPTPAQLIKRRPKGSFPVPPLDLEVPPSPRARRAVAEREPVPAASVGRNEAATGEATEKEV